jgi:DNA polymerase-3 subunit delta'
MGLYSQAGWGVIGHEWAVAHLTLSLNSGRTRHAYLLSGAPNVGKTTFALALARALNCLADENRPCGLCRACTLIQKRAYPDMHLLEAENVGGTLKIDQIRELQSKLNMRSYEARYRVAILRRFQEANAASANALLKTLEEPPAHVVLILTTDNLQALLPTILSRCQQIPLQTLPKAQVESVLRAQGLDTSQAALLAALSGGRVGWALRAAQDESLLAQRQDALDTLESLLSKNRAGRFAEAESLSKDKDSLRGWLHYWLSFWRDAFLLAQNSERWLVNVDRLKGLRQVVQATPYAHIAKALQATRRTIDYLGANVNTRLALEVMLLDYPFLGKPSSR